MILLNNFDGMSMRRISLEISKELVDQIGFKDLMSYIEKLEILHIYRFDNQNLYAIQSFKFIDPDFKPKNLIGISGIQLIETLSKDEKENEYICLVKTHKEEGFHVLFEDFNLIIDFPLVITQETIKIAIIAPDDQLKLIIDVLDKYKILNITPIKREENDFALTKRQLEIMSYSVKKGYFEIPRKIGSDSIAQHFNISTSALNEHYRKVEKKIFDLLFQDEKAESLISYLKNKKSQNK